MSSNIIYSDHITDFQRILYFLTENNMSTSEIAHVNLDECHLKIKTKEIYNNFNVKLSKDLSNVTCGSDNGDELSLKYF